MEPYTLILNAGAAPQTSDLLRLAQDAASAHLDAMGLTGVAEKQGLAWVIIRTHMECYAPISGEIRCETWPAPGKMGFRPRHCRFFSPEGTLLAQSVSLWVLADAQSRSLSVTADFPLPEILTGAELPLPRALPRKTMEPAGDFAVDPAWIDSNGHMNNTCYLRAAEEVLHLTGLPKRFTADYRAELLPGNTATVCAQREENVLRVAFLCGEKEHFRMILEY